MTGPAPGEGTAPSAPSGEPRLPPRWFMRSFWLAHRRVYRLTRGHVGLWRPGRRMRWGAMCVHAIGRRSGEARDVMVGYVEDGPDVVALAMNGWGEGEPAWWLNVQAHPDVRIDLRGESREVTAREAHGEERDRLWERWRTIDHDLDAFAARRPRRTAVVVFEPRGAAARDG